jgi:hypothetical protein
MENFSRVMLRYGIPVVLIAIAAYLGAFLFQVQYGPVRAWSQDSYSGRVTAVGGDSITIVDKGSEIRTVHISPDTRVRDGRRESDIAALSIGDFTIVVGSKDESGAYTAQMIRIVTSGSGEPER